MSFNEILSSYKNRNVFVIKAYGRAWMLKIYTGKSKKKKNEKWILVSQNNTINFQYNPCQEMERRACTGSFCDRILTVYTQGIVYFLFKRPRRRGDSSRLLVSTERGRNGSVGVIYKFQVSSNMIEVLRLIVVRTSLGEKSNYPKSNTFPSSVPCSRSAFPSPPAFVILFRLF